MEKSILSCACTICAVLGLSAMPTKDEALKAEPSVRRLMEAEQAALASGKKTRSEVADAALKLVQAADTEAAKLLLMKGAFVLYVKDGKVEKAAQTMNAIETTIADLPPQSVTNMIEFALLGLPNKKDVRDQLYQQRQRPDGRVASMRRLPEVAATSSMSSDQRAVGLKSPHEGRTTIQSIIDGMIKVPGKDYWLSSTEVTQGQWESIMGYNLSEHRGAEFPAEHVGRDDCDAFIEKLNQTKEAKIARLKFAVPTHQEWGYAAAAGGTGAGRPWIKPGIVGNVLDMAWVQENSSNQTHAVATKMPNAWGFYDMQGNVHEWVITLPEGVGPEKTGTSVFFPAKEVLPGWWWGGDPHGRGGDTGLRLAAHIRPIEDCAFIEESATWGTAEVDGSTWSYFVSKGEATIAAKSGDTFVCAVSPKPTGSVVMPSVIGGARVTGVGAWAFKDCEALASVKIPETVTSIGDGAFAGCDRLKSVQLPSGVKSIGRWAFQGCGRLTSIAIPSKVETIAYRTFGWCRGLTSVTIPSNVRNIEGAAFIGCLELTSVTIANGVTNIGNSAFVDCGGLSSVTMPGSVRRIGANAFRGCGKLKSALLPVGVERIEWGAYLSCQDLTSVVIPSTVKTIRHEAFAHCGSLKSLTIEEGVTNISGTAFLKSSLKTVTIPKSVVNIGEAFAECGELESVTMLGEKPNAPKEVFRSCPKLKEIRVPANAKSWAGIKEWQGKKLVFDAKAEDGATAKNAGNAGQLQASINGYTWSYRVYNGEATIEAKKDGKFTGALNPAPMGHVTIPSSLDGIKVTAIGNSAFSEYTGLTSVTIPEGVRSIESDAFLTCSMVSVAIPASVTNVSVGAFSCNSKLMSFSVDAANPAYTSRNGVLLSKDGKALISGVNGDVVIPPGVQTIVGHAFRGRQKLTSVVISPSVTVIGGAAFWQCSGLTSVILPHNLKRLECSALRETGLKSITIPPSVTDITWSVLYGCRELTSVTLPLTAMHIEGIAFMFCTKLESITIPANVKRIDGRAFGWCPELTSVTMCGECPTTPEPVFPNCPKLTEIHVPANAKSWAGMKEWQGKKLVFDAKAEDWSTAEDSRVNKDRTTIQSILDGMIKVPGRNCWLSSTEVTQGQWESIMGYNLSKHKGANLPVENVSRDECAIFLEKLNASKEVLSTQFEFVLPTLVEWSYAAQAGGSDLDCWIKPGVVGSVLDMAWVAENSSNETHAVATKAPNAFGFYDMLGNVWEWMNCEQENVGCRHGGSFCDPASDCTVRKGYHSPRNRRFDCYGFRLAAHIRSVAETWPDNF